MFRFRRGTESGQAGGVRFSSDIRRALQQAREEAGRFGSGYVGTEHILLALTESPTLDPARILAALAIRIDYLRNELESILDAESPARHRKRTALGVEDLPYTSGAKRLLETAMKEARELGQAPVRSTHLLLGVIAESRSAAGRLLGQLGVTLDKARSLVRSGLPSEPQLAIRIDDKSDRLIYQQIVEQIQENIATGRVQPGERLPAIRQLADDLEIAPGTVARAYSELEAAGVVITDRARGTFVAHPGPPAQLTDRRPVAIRDLLRPVVVAAFHLGSTAVELRAALEQAMMDIYPETT